MMNTPDLLHKTIVIQAGPAVVWNQLTDPLRIREWLADGEIDAFFEPRAGSAIRFQGNLHGFAYEAKGTILLFEPEQVFEYTYWNPMSHLPDQPAYYTRFRFELKALPSGTELSFTHSAIVGEAVYEHSNMYWSVTLGMIKALCEKG